MLPESIPKPQLKLASIITFMFIPFATDGGTYGYGYLGHPMDGISAHSTVNIANPFAAPDAEAFLRSGPLLLDDGWINSSPSGIPANTHDHQVNPEVGLLAAVHVYVSTHTGLPIISDYRYSPLASGRQVNGLVQYSWKAPRPVPTMASFLSSVLLKQQIAWRPRISWYEVSLVLPEKSDLTF